MQTGMSSVDILNMAASVAGILRSAGDADAALAELYAALGRQPPEPSEPLPVRIVQLILHFGDNRQHLYDYLRKIEGPFAWGRPPTASDEQLKLVDEDPQARRYVELLEAEQLGPGYSMFWRCDTFPFAPSFRLLERTAVLWFAGPVIVVRDGQELSPAAAAPPQTGDVWTCREMELPKRVKGLIDYPFEIATLFDIETGHAPWDVWNICCAFAGQYLKLYERPEEYGIWGNDLSDLWIEDLVYYPDHQLIYPEVGS